MIVGRFTLFAVGTVIWILVTIAIFQIAHSRQTENDLFEQYGERAEGKIAKEFTESSFLPIGRGFRNQSCLIVCSYVTKQPRARESTVEVGPEFFKYFSVGGIVRLYYLSQGPEIARIAIPEDSEYHDLYAVDMFGLGLLGCVLGIGFSTVSSGLQVSRARPRDVAFVALLVSLFIILVLLALRQGW
jgi:hypothetical protein